MWSINNLPACYRHTLTGDNRLVRIPGNCALQQALHSKGISHEFRHRIKNKKRNSCLVTLATSLTKLPTRLQRRDRLLQLEIFRFGAIEMTEDLLTCAD